MMGALYDTLADPRHRSDVNHLVSLGFDENLAKFALEQHGGDLQRAAAMLVEAREEERREKMNARFPIQNVAGSKKTESTPKKTASSSSTSSSSLVDASTRRALSSSPAVTKMLVYVIQTIVENPREIKYHSIKTTTPNYRETIGKSPVAEGVLLKILGFEPTGEWIAIKPSRINIPLMRRVLEELRTIQASETYQAAERAEEYDEAVRASLSTATAEETARRASYRGLLPPTPPPGAAGTTRLTIKVGGEERERASRAFHSENTLRDVVHWIGAEVSSSLADQLLEGRISLVDVTFFKRNALDVHSTKSLQGLNLWPSATLEVQRGGGDV